MLHSIRLRNFRGFNDHSTEFKPTTIVVGANNAGKSSLVEALRLIAIVTKRYQNLTYKRPNAFLADHGATTGITPSLKGTEIDLRRVFHRYGDPPSIIDAKFANGSSISIYINENSEFHACITGSDGKRVLNKAKAASSGIPTVAILPQISPVRAEEAKLNEDYVKRALESNLASLHFRNQLYLLKEHAAVFHAALSETWPSVAIVDIIKSGNLIDQDEKIHVNVRVDDFVTELGEMGHGLQMWMQTMWFLSRSTEADCVILDEPDVYMHADLQRRLVRYIRGKYKQLIIATHSVEIISEVSHEQILILNKTLPQSEYASTLPAVQSTLQRMGTAHNLQLTRLWDARRVLVVEGKDVTYLKAIQNLLYPNSHHPLDTIPHFSIGGWSGWEVAIGSKLLLKNAIGERIRVYCVLDSDYHTPNEIQKRLEQAKSKGIELKVWSRKEIENYAISAPIIQRIIIRRSNSIRKEPSIEEIEVAIEDILAEQETEIFDKFATAFFDEDRKSGTPAANRRTRTKLANEKAQTGSIRNLASGKSLISSLSNWSQTKFSVSFGPNALFNEMRRDEVPEELAEFITQFELSKPVRVEQ